MPTQQTLHPIDIIRAMMEYHHTRMDQLWDCIMTLTDEQFTADVDYSHGSIRNHMVHLSNVDRGWVRGLQEDPNARVGRAENTDYPTAASARQLWENTVELVKAYMATVDEVALAKTPLNMPLPVWQTLLHLVNHGTDHRAQVLRILTALGAASFEQDLAFHFMGR